jgi:hypothetical protein
VFDLTNDLESFDLAQDNRRGQVLSPGKGTQKETIATSPTDSLLKLAYSPRCSPREGFINHAAPSDEQMTPKPLDTESIEEAETESITDVPTQSSVESMTPSATQRPTEEHIEQGKSPKRTAVPEKRVIEVEEESVFSEEENVKQYAEQYKRNSYMKVVDSKADKFAKTKASLFSALLGISRCNVRHSSCVAAMLLYY